MRAINLLNMMEDRIDEKLIIVNKGKKYGQIVFLTGGAGSGKGFAREKYMEGEKYKVRDVDEWKRLFIKIDELKGLYPEIRGLNLRLPEDVAKLHEFTDNMLVKEHTMTLLLDTLSQDRLHNLLFDVTAKNIASVTRVAEELINHGYASEDIHLIWVLANMELAAQRNRDRARVVPEEILRETHIGAARTMKEFIFNNAKYQNIINGEVYVILSADNATEMYPVSPNARVMNPQAPVEKQKKFQSIKDFSYVKLKMCGKPVEFTNDANEKLTDWIMNNAPVTESDSGSRYTKPKEFGLWRVIDEYPVDKELTLSIVDSDPYDAIVFVVNGHARAVKYVSNWKKEIPNIEANVKQIKQDLKTLKW